jgi:hypothetical protein
MVSWRFFRIEDTGIVEIGQDGTPLKEFVYRGYTDGQSGVSKEKRGCSGEGVT